MGDVVNLNKFRKARSRKAEGEAAAVNRARFGRRRHEKAAERATFEQEKAALDGKRRTETRDTHDPGATPEKPTPKSP